MDINTYNKADYVNEHTGKTEEVYDFGFEE
jgi:hypothetical protein